LETATLPIELLAYKLFLSRWTLLFSLPQSTPEEQIKRKRERKIF
jgi:hypothetical protein